MDADTTLDVLIVGAGFSGLATAAALRRYGIDALRLIEAEGGYGGFWRNTYDRIALHSPWHGLPDDGGMAFEYPMFKRRDQLLEYFERYAARHALGAVARFDERLEHAELDSGADPRGWRVTTSRGHYHARYLVIATGYCRQPRMPAIAGLESVTLPLVHSAAYRNARPFVGRDVLVVGSGNSAFEIATDLVEGGAGAVTLLVHGARWVVPIDALEAAMHAARAAGVYSVEAIVAAHPFGAGTAGYAAGVAALDSLLIDIAIDMRAFGIDTPSQGPWDAALHDNRVPVFDHGAVDLLRSGRITALRDRIRCFEGDAVVLEAGGRRCYDAVIMATGFEPGLEGFFGAGSAPVAPNARLKGGFPLTDGRCASRHCPGLYFVGYDFSAWGGMAHGYWGFEVGEKIARELGTFSPARRPVEFSRAPWAA